MYGVTKQRAHQVCMQELAKWGMRADEVNMYERTVKMTRTKTLTFLERIEAKLVTMGTHRLWLGATNNGSPVIMYQGRVGSVRRHLWLRWDVREPLPRAQKP